MNEYLTIPIYEYESLCEIKKNSIKKDERITELELQLIADTKTITRLSEEIHNAKMRMEK